MEKKNDPNMQELDPDRLEAVSGGADDEQQREADDDQQRRDGREYFDNCETTAHSKRKRGLLAMAAWNGGRTER